LRVSCVSPWATGELLRTKETVDRESPR
jgi:hypothetical protein